MEEDLLLGRVETKGLSVEDGRKESNRRHRVDVTQGCTRQRPESKSNEQAKGGKGE
jgi:hypothetical protein